jgi:hypothetical protein
MVNLFENLDMDILDLFDNIERYCEEKLRSPLSNNLDLPLSSVLESELTNNPGGSVILDKINETKISVSSLPKQQQIAAIDDLWREVHDHFNG